MYSSGQAFDQEQSTAEESEETKSNEEDEAGQLKEGEPGKEDDELEESPPYKLSKEDFCRCRSKCLRKPYCKCKAKSTLCKEACHPSNRKCINK